MKSVPLVLSILATVVCLAGCGIRASSGTAEFSPPMNWPIDGLTLPVGSRDAEFSPGPLTEIVSKLPEKRRMGRVRSQPPPPQWNAFFGYTGQPAEVFDHFDKFLEEKQYMPIEKQDLEIGTENESRNHTFESPDKSYSVSIRYWKVSDLPNARPYQLLVRDIRPRKP